MNSFRLKNRVKSLVSDRVVLALILFGVVLMCWSHVFLTQESTWLGSAFCSGLLNAHDQVSPSHRVEDISELSWPEIRSAMERLEEENRTEGNAYVGQVYVGCVVRLAGLGCGFLAVLRIVVCACTYSPSGRFSSCRSMSEHTLAVLPESRLSQGAQP